MSYESTVSRAINTLALLAVAGFLAANPASLSAATRPAPPSPLEARVDREIERITPEIVAVRHDLHQNPELGNRETRTAGIVAERLTKLGMEVRKGVAKTGVVGILRGGKPGPVVAIRADMDALPVTEESDLPFKSTQKATYLGKEVGVAHACGHDIHTSVQLGVAEVLAAAKEQLPGTVMFVFQPAEEGPPPGEEGGAELMMKEGVFDDPKPVAIFGLHSFPDYSVGQVGLNEGPTFAAVDHFVAKIRGKQSHGAYPHQGVDPVVISAQAILALQTIRSRNVPALEPSVVTVGIVRGGERFNIIPDEVMLEGTVRTYSPEVRDQIERRMREILDGITRAGGGTYELDYQRTSPATVNQPALTQVAREILERALGAEQVITSTPTMGGEDFAYFANAVPGVYYRLGTVAPGTTSGGLHTPNFRADDTAIPVGIRAMARLVVGYLERGPTKK